MHRILREIKIFPQDKKIILKDNVESWEIEHELDPSTTLKEIAARWSGYLDKVKWDSKENEE